MQTKQTYRYIHTHKRNGVQNAARFLLTLFLLGTLTTLLSACGSDPAGQQQATQKRAGLDHSISYAQNIGVPGSSLQPVISQEQALNATHAPFELLGNTLVNDYYSNLATRYQQLTVQSQGIIQVSTEQLAQQAQDSLQSLHEALAAKQSSNLPLATLTQLYNQNMAAMQKAHYPKDFQAIGKQAADAIATLNVLPDSLEKLQTLSQVITIMQGGHQDVSDLQKNYADDKNAIAAATTPGALQQTNQAIDAQNQQATSKFVQVIPLLTNAKVNELSDAIQQVKQYGVDTTVYQKRLATDRAQAQNVKTLQDYLTFSKQVDKDLASMHNDMLKGQTVALVKQFHAEVDAWGNAHQYHDKYNGQNYPLDGAYMTKGIGEDLDRELNNAATVSDYQQALTDTQNALFHLHMLEADAKDTTPYQQVHATDQQLLNYYKLQHSQVIVVSFIEEALRVYDNGKLVRSFLVTAGRPELPPVPGLWVPLWRQYHTTFKSPYPPGSPYYYAPTPINYAILYHQGGYYLHDSWWRNDYGPGTQFYHIDSSGNVSADYGTHGCINMPEDQAAWVYNNTDYNTQVVMY
jgi:lipoprotein-anchoring transpeptidase ErfK/SrfK